MEGQLAIWKSGLNEDYPCYECIFPRTNEKAPITNCRDAGIIGPVTGLIGSMQVNEAIKEIALKDYQSTAGNLFLYDGLTLNLDKIKLKKGGKIFLIILFSSTEKIDLLFCIRFNDMYKVIGTKTRKIAERICRSLKKNR